MYKKQVLMIAYFFPPMGGSGSLRPLKLAKNLPENGWDPVVLTVKNPDWYYAIDPALLHEIPSAVIYRTPMVRSAWIYRLFNPLRAPKLDRWIRNFLIYPDDQIGWIPSGYLTGARIIRSHPIRAIYSTSAPMSCHLIAYLIKLKTGLPWIADFRDEWFENPDFYYPTPIHRRMHYWLEKKVVSYADHVIAAAPGFCRLLAKHPGCGKKCTPIFTGFDPDDFQGKNSAVTAGQGGKVFTIAFSGLFYASFRPAKIVSAVNGLIDAGGIPPDKIRILFVGANTPQDIHAPDVYNICRFTGFVSHHEALQHINASDALLLLLSRERGDFVVPGKTFEYIASGKPILAAVPEESEVASIIRKTRTGIVVDFDDEIGLRRAVLQMYRQWDKNEIRLIPDEKEIAVFNQRHQVKGLAQLLDNLARPPSIHTSEGK